jgi:pyrroline-5-carboxylate reductase
VKAQYGGVLLPTDNVELIEKSDVVFLCIKPVDFPPVLAELSRVDLGQKLIVSLNATVPFEVIEKAIGRQRMAKVVPSVTAEVGESPTLVAFSQTVSSQDKEFLVDLLSQMGPPEEVREEALGFGSELMSCMPGFLACVLSEFAKAATRYGVFDEDRISDLLKRTVLGTGKLLLEKKMSFSDLMGRVATKGGITREGILVIEERMPTMAEEVFAVTMRKRREIEEATRKAFAGST